AVRAGGDGGPRHRRHLAADPGAVARVRDDGQVRERLHDGDRGQVEEVAGLLVEAAHTALAQDDLVVPLREDVLRAEQQLLDRGGRAALQAHRPAGPARAPQPRLVLHVAGADLDAVAVLGEVVATLRYERIGVYIASRLPQ